MFIKNFIITRKQDNSHLALINHHLNMVDKYQKHPFIYLSTIDMKSGILHDGKTVIDQIIIHSHQNHSVSLISKKSNQCYQSIPLQKQQIASRFYSSQHHHHEWTRFNLKIISEPNFTIYDYQKLNEQTDNAIIHLFWWQANDFINLGDELNLYITAFLSQKIIRKTTIEHTDLLGIGSILDWATPREKPYPVWGSGTLAPHRLNNALYQPALLRGPLTHATFNNPDFNIPYGDPALISDRIWTNSIHKKYDWGLIIHHSHYQKLWVQHLIKNTSNIIFIDITNPDIDEFFQQLKSCKAIASSSLHGLILADSYHIPNIWLWDHNLHEGGKWKFFDYFAGIHRTEIDSFTPSQLQNLDQLSTNTMNFSYFDKLEKIKNEIIDSFPL